MYEVEFSTYDRPEVFEAFNEAVRAIRQSVWQGEWDTIIGLIEEDHGIKLEQWTGNPDSTKVPYCQYRARFQDEQHYLMWMLKYG